MSTRFRRGTVGWLVAGVVASFAVGSVAQGGEPPEVQALKKATVNNKYSHLLAVLHAPEEKSSYGELYDFGAYSGTEWAGHTGLPQGYWVYAYPHWYIWRQETKSDGALRLKEASINGKFTRLLAVIHVPEDTGSYGDVHDYGVYSGTGWAGYTGLPQGYWVYAYPHWYIWEAEGQQLP